MEEKPRSCAGPTALVNAFIPLLPEAKAISRQAEWLPWRETEPQREQGSDGIIPVSPGNDDKGRGQLLCSDTYPRIRAVPRETGDL